MYIHAQNSSRYQGMFIARPEGPIFRGEYAADYLGFFGFEKLHPNLFPVDHYFFKINNRSPHNAHADIENIMKLRFGEMQISDISRTRILKAYNRHAVLLDNNTLSDSVGSRWSDSRSPTLDATVFSGIDYRGMPFLYVGIPTTYDKPVNLPLPICEDSEVVIPQTGFASPCNTLDHFKGFLMAFNRLPILRLETKSQYDFLMCMSSDMSFLFPPSPLFIPT